MARKYFCKIVLFSIFLFKNCFNCLFSWIVWKFFFKGWLFTTQLSFRLEIRNRRKGSFAFEWSIMVCLLCKKKDKEVFYSSFQLQLFVIPSWIEMTHLLMNWSVAIGVFKSHFSQNKSLKRVFEGVNVWHRIFVIPNNLDERIY